IAQLLQLGRGGRTPGGGVVALGLLHQYQGRQHLADLVGVRGVAPGKLLDGGALALPERLDELIRDLAERVGGGRLVIDHPQTPSMPPGMPWKTSFSRLSART